jgi:hypothetical protein
VGAGVFGAGLAALLAYALWLGRDLSFFSDDWDIIAFHHRGNYLEPFNSHLTALPVAVFRGLFLTVGLGSYTPYRVVGLLVYGALGLLLYLYARRRVPPVLAALAALSIVWFSAGDINVLFPFLINFSIPLAATILIWNLLDRDTLGSDIGAGVCLAVALASSGIGLMAVAAVAAELAVRRAPLRRWLPFVPPFVLWLLWYAGYHDPIADHGGLGEVAKYAYQEIEATFASFAGGWIAGGYVAMAATAVILWLSITRWKTFNARAVGALAGMASFTALTAYSRIGIVPPIPPDTGRYLWINAFFLVVALIECGRGVRIAWPVVAVAAISVTVGAAVLVGNLRTYHEEVVDYKNTVRTYMVAVEAIPDQIDRERIMPLSYIVVSAGEYLDAVDHLGTPLGGVGLDDLGDEVDRAAADLWMIEDLDLRLVPGAAAPAGACRTISPEDGSDDVAVRDEATVVVQAGDAPVTVALRRLARDFDHDLVGEVAAGQAGVVELPVDHSSLPWHVRVHGSPTAVSVCR